jgi:mono/diheme cytochrome c family protein
MRYTRIGLASYSIGAVLVATVVGVAWARSRVTAPSGSAGEPAADVGAAVYATECRACHGQGEARGRNLPALRGGVVGLFRSEGGRDYLVDLLLDGRVRRADGAQTTYVASHPAYARLSDAELAAVLNHMLSSWGNEALLPRETVRYSAAEVAARRGR